MTHLGLILDGNRRYAKAHNLPTIAGHKAGADALEKILVHLKKSDVTQVTIYTFSTENFNRSVEEVDGLMNLFLQLSDSVFGAKEDEVAETKIVFLGDKSRFKQNIQDKIHELEDKTRNSTKRTLNVAFGYGGRDEIVRAVQKIVDSGEKNITEELVTQSLDLSDEPDLIIRTGGACRTSNFLPWQSVYSEWFFVDKFWPEMTPEDVDSILEEFTQRKRRFGK